MTSNNYSRERGTGRIKAKFAANCESDDTFSEGTTENISLMGVRYISPHNYNKGEKVDFCMEVSRPDEGYSVTLPFGGEVMWSREVNLKDNTNLYTFYRVGIRFHSVDSITYETFQDMISDLSGSTHSILNRDNI